MVCHVHAQRIQCAETVNTMKYAYFDCFSGVSGDMILGALLHAGAPFDDLKAQLSLLNVSGYSLETEDVVRQGIKGVYCRVKTEEHHHHRHLPDIEKIIRESGVAESVKEKAIRIFTNLAEAEGRVHGIPPDKVHFHEVGALDAIIDIVGAVICLDSLGIDMVFSSPMTFGTGFVRAAHGEMPVPVPATLELTRGYPFRQTDIPMELTTPTGAAIVTTLSKGTVLPTDMKITALGYGAGSREIQNRPNLLRVLILEDGEKETEDQVAVIESNIDDMNPEIYPYLMERVLEAGALDAFITPAIMKKGRPGSVLTVISPVLKHDEIVALLFRETTTIGVRTSRWHRKKLPREQIEIQTPWGKVRCKKIVRDGSEQIVPEFEECRKIALANHLAMQQVYKAIQAAADKDGKTGDDAGGKAAKSRSR